MLFTVEIDESCLDTLDQVIQTILSDTEAGVVESSMATSPEVLIAGIFSQFRCQRIKQVLTQKGRGVGLSPDDPEPQESSDCRGGYEDGSQPSCSDNEKEEYFTPRCLTCGVEAEEWDTVCFECGGSVK